MLICAADIGTTSVKAMIADGSGRRLASASAAYPLLTSPGGIVEQDARLWRELTARAVRECAAAVRARDVACLCLSAQGGSVVPVDGRGEPLARAATWMDTRGAEHTAALLAARGQDWFFRSTGRKLLESNGIAKIMAFRSLRPARFLTTLEYVNLKLTGRAAGDPSSAAMTNLLDVGARDYHPEILRLAGIRRGELPDILPTGETVGPLTGAAARDLGLPEGIPVVNGGHDQICAAVGAGILSPGDILLSTGSAWVVLGVPGSAPEDMGLSVSPHAPEGVSCVFSSVPTGGVALDWVRGKLLRGGMAEYDALNRETGARLGRNTSLTVHPHFSVEKASIRGLDLSADAYDIALSAMEGVVFEARRIMEAIRAGGYSGGSVKLIGGAAKAPTWQTLVRSVVGPVRVFDDAEMASAGAAALGGTAVGLWRDLAEASEALGDSRELPACREHRDFYEGKYNRYLKEGD